MPHLGPAQTGAGGHDPRGAAQELTGGCKDLPDLTNMEEEILALLRRLDYTPLNISELAAQLEITHPKQRQLEQVLARLERAGQIARIKKGDRYGLPLQADLLP